MSQEGSPTFGVANGDRDHRGSEAHRQPALAHPLLLALRCAAAILVTID